MPTQQSPLEIERNQQRVSTHEHARLRKITGVIRGMVERALSLNFESGRIERQLQDFEQDTGDFRARAQADRLDWQQKCVLIGAIVLCASLDFLASGDVAETLARQMAPLFEIDPEAESMPVWLRRVAGVALALGILAGTILVKLVLTLVLRKLKADLSSLVPGEEARYRNLTFAISAVYLSKIAYVTMIAGLYVWLYGFAQQRAQFMADVSSEQTQSSDWGDIGVKFEGGVLETEETVPTKTTEASDKEIAARLAGATGVFYAVIVLLHTCVLLLPANGFGRELELAHFKKGPAQSKAAILRAEEHRSLREIYEYVRIAPESYRSDLVEATEPVHAAINRLYGRTVIRISGVEFTPPDSNGFHSAVSSQTPSSNGLNVNGNAHTAGASDSNGEADASDAAWDAIFPPSQPI